MNVKSKILESGLIDILTKKMSEKTKLEEKYVKKYLEQKLDESLNDLGKMMSSVNLKDSNVSNQKTEINSTDLQDLIDKGYKLLKDE